MIGRVFAKLSDLTQKRFIFSLFKSATNTLHQSNYKQFPANNFELAITITKGIENKLNGLGLHGGFGIVEKIAPHKINPFIQDRIKFVASARNKLVHHGVPAITTSMTPARELDPQSESYNESTNNSFNRKEYIRAYMDIVKYLDSMEEIVKSDRFKNWFYNERAGKGSILEGAEQFRISKLKELQKSQNTP